jgi:hypothetical protein
MLKYEYNLCWTQCINGSNNILETALTLNSYTGREKNSNTIGLQKFHRVLRNHNEANGTDYTHETLFPCPVDGCIFFGLSKQLFKMKKFLSTYDLPRVDGKVDMSQSAWRHRNTTDQLCLTLVRHFTCNIDPETDNISEPMRQAHIDNVPPCLEMLCRRSTDKNYNRLKALLNIAEVDDE